MERYSMFLGRKNQYCENDYTTKCNLHIQCNAYKTTNGISHRTKHFTIHIETQKIPNNQSSLKKEEWSWRNQLSWLQTTDHKSTVIKTVWYWHKKQKYRPIEQNRKPRSKPMHLWVPYFSQRRKEYTMGQR